MLRYINTLLITLIASLVIGCNEKASKYTDTPSTGTINISADESYRPIIEQQLQVFDSSFPDAHINMHYKSETECINDFKSDSARLILITRDLSEAEKQNLLDNKVVTHSLPIAKDAIAIIANNNNMDSTVSISELKGILTGENVNNYTVVFDNQGSSTLRYMLDSIIPGEKLGKNVFATHSNDSVISYVANNKNAIGVVGVSHVSDFNDPEGLAFIDNVQIMSVLNDSLERYYKPYQIYIAPNQYPLVRHLYYVHRETHQGLANSFARFLREYRGQLIFKSGRLFPTRVNIIFRGAEVNQ